MYKGNPNLRAAGEEVEYSPELIEEFVKCKTDIIYFAEKYFEIVHIDRGKIKIPLHDFQKRMLKTFIDPGGKRHCIVNASRQIGKTTVSTIYLLHTALFNSDKTIAILANKEKTAREILRRVKLAYENLPIWLQQGIREGGWNKASISLENGTRFLAASTASSAIRGESISTLMLDEFAHIPDHIAEDFMASVYPTVASGKTSQIIIVSTPNGMNHFFDIWKNAVRELNNFRAIKVRWHEVPGRDEQWKKETISDIGIVKFRQEFECKFLGSQSTLIDPDILEEMKPDQPISVKYGGYMQVWEEPIPKMEYVLGVDSAGGTGSDYSVIQVLKIINETNVEQVAIYRNNTVDTLDFSQHVISISQYYNNAMLMIEVPGHGDTVAKIIWWEYEYDYIVNLDPKKKQLGVRSTKKSKREANDLLKRYFERGWIKIHGKETIRELSMYEEIKPGVYQCPRGDHDDCVTSLLWAVYFIETPLYEGKSTNQRELEERFKLAAEEDYDNLPAMVFDEVGGVGNEFEEEFDE